MNKYTFISEGDDGEMTEKMTLVCEFITWAEGFEKFRQFLNGCGFIVPDGEWVKNENA